VIAWGRMLQGQLRASERRLEELAVDPTSPLGEMAAELHRVTALGPQLGEVRSLLAGLEKRARTLRSEWVSRQAESGQSSAQGMPPNRSPLTGKPTKQIRGTRSDHT
jgi:hypothetical protein